MPTTIDSMTGVEIKSPFFDTAVSLELFPVHPNVLKNPNAPQKNRVALIYGSNGSGKSTILITSSLKLTKPVLKEFCTAFKNFAAATLCNSFRTINNALR